MSRFAETAETTFVVIVAILYQIVFIILLGAPFILMLALAYWLVKQT